METLNKGVISNINIYLDRQRTEEFLKEYGDIMYEYIKDKSLFEIYNSWKEK